MTCSKLVCADAYIVLDCVCFCGVRSYRSARAQIVSGAAGATLLVQHVLNFHALLNLRPGYVAKLALICLKLV